MRIELPAIPIEIQKVGELVYLQISKWKEHSVYLINECAPYLQNTVNASLALVVLNIGVFHLSTRIGKLVHKIFDFCQPHERASDLGKGVRKWIYGGVVVITIGTLNHVFCHMFRIPFAVWKIAGIVFLTDISCLIWRAY